MSHGSDPARRHCTTATAAGTHSITATYNGSGTISASTSAVLPQVVLLATTTTQTSAPNPSVVGQNVTFTATVTSSGGTPQGSVAFYDSNTLLATIALNNGTAIYSTTSLPAATHSITAKYSGSNTFAASSATVKQRVTRK
jgi:Big-like domain-containing protein